MIRAVRRISMAVFITLLTLLFLLLWSGAMGQAVYAETDADQPVAQEQVEPDVTLDEPAPSEPAADMEPSGEVADAPEIVDPEPAYVPETAEAVDVAEGEPADVDADAADGETTEETGEITPETDADGAIASATYDSYYDDGYYDDSSEYDDSYDDTYDDSEVDSEEEPEGYFVSVTKLVTDGKKVIKDNKKFKFLIGFIELFDPGYYKNTSIDYELFEGLDDAKLIKSGYMDTDKDGFLKFYLKAGQTIFFTNLAPFTMYVVGEYKTAGYLRYAFTLNDDTDDAFARLQSNKEIPYHMGFASSTKDEENGSGSVMFINKKVGTSSYESTVVLDSDIPQTGDEDGLAMWCVMLVAAVALLALMGYRRLWNH